MVIAFMLAAFTASRVLAPQLDDVERDSLKGMRSMRMLVEDLAPAAGECGVEEEGIKLAAARPLVDAQITVGKATEATLYVNVHVLKTRGGLCAANVRTEARTFVTAPLPHSGTRPVFAIVLLWSRSQLLTGGADDFGQRVRSGIKEMVDELATKIKLANAEKDVPSAVQSGRVPER